MPLIVEVESVVSSDKTSTYGQYAARVVLDRLVILVSPRRYDTRSEADTDAVAIRTALGLNRRYRVRFAGEDEVVVAADLMEAVSLAQASLAKHPRPDVLGSMSVDELEPPK